MPKNKNKISLDCPFKTGRHFIKAAAYSHRKEEGATAGCQSGGRVWFFGGITRNQRYLSILHADMLTCSHVTCMPAHGMWMLMFMNGGGGIEGLSPWRKRSHIGGSDWGGGHAIRSNLPSEVTRGIISQSLNVTANLEQQSYWVLGYLMAFGTRWVI